jgi:hypothetical protein
VDRIVAYEKYAPPTEMLLSLYMELVGRDEFPTDAECALLGNSKALKIHRARETLIRAQKKAGTRSEAAQIKALVAKTLGLTDTPAVNSAGMCFPILFPALVDRLIVGNTAAPNGANAQEDGEPSTSRDRKPVIPVSSGRVLSYTMSTLIACIRALVTLLHSPCI